MDYLSLKSLIAQLSQKHEIDSALHLPIVIDKRKFVFSSSEKQQMITGTKEWNVVNLSFGSPHVSLKGETKCLTLSQLRAQLLEYCTEDEDAPVTFDDHLIQKFDVIPKVTLAIDTLPLSKTLAQTKFNPFRAIPLSKHIEALESNIGITDPDQKRNMLTELQTVLPDGSGIFVYRLINQNAPGKKAYIVSQIFHNYTDYTLEFLVTRHIIMKAQ